MISVATNVILPPDTRILAISNAKARGFIKSGSKIDLSFLPKHSFHHISYSKSDLGPLISEAAKLNIEHILVEGGTGLSEPS